MMKLSAKRASSMRPAPNAVRVLANTIGFTTGAASRKATPTRNGSPLASSRRTTTTMPHSHTGSARPSAAPARAASTGWRGINRASAAGRTNTSTNPEANAPASRNGTASMKIPRKMVVKVCSRSATDTGAAKAASIDACRVAANHAASSTSSSAAPPATHARRRAGRAGRAAITSAPGAGSESGSCAAIKLYHSAAVRPRGYPRAAAARGRPGAVPRLTAAGAGATFRA